MTLAHIWMFSAYVMWVDCMSGAWLRVPRERKARERAC